MDVSRNGSPVPVLSPSQEPGEEKAPGRLSKEDSDPGCSLFTSLSTSWSLGNRPNGSRYCLCWGSIFREVCFLGSLLGKCKQQ